MSDGEYKQDPRAERPGMAAALAALKKPVGKPTEGDRPPPSTFPMTPAARAALRMSKRNEQVEIGPVLTRQPSNVVPLEKKRRSP